MFVTPVASLPGRLALRARDVWPGLLVCVGIAVVASLIGHLVPVLGGAVPAIVIGVGIALVRRPGGRLMPGIEYSSKFLLQCAVVLLGAQLSLASIFEVGLESLPVMLSTLAVCLLAAWAIGRALRIEPRLRTLIGVGTGICGASAIAAVSPVITAASAEVAYAVSTIFLFNVLAVLLFPLLGHALHMSPHAFGLLAGTAVNDTSSVVATASVYGAAALSFAVVVKLVRTLMIIPITVTLAAVEARRTASRGMSAAQIGRLVPWFLIGFLVVAIINSLGVITPGVQDGLVQLSVFLIAVALAGIGLSTDVAALRRAGLKPLLLGAILWVLVTATSLLVIWLTGGLG
ncbi:putative sulfate exporter family transporter [Microbacterium horticulturae]|uniref:Sulfate exporter family transporter n=1 Tax=Microbacterium horticulturae TaxID=3028316 RepID=A0ABY8C3S1_9MICO|nr:putative sulfate exporter family transporter [Microbacterium sp. KACC 23027]WEG09273.1 putative sulfate exporter family transporter [Microbacterium sp. KACC 23027]